MKSFKNMLLELAFKSVDLLLYDKSDIGSTHDVKQYMNNGKIYYVKTPTEYLYEYYTDPILHILVEYLSYEIYNFYNIKVPFVDLYIKNNKIMLASEKTVGHHILIKDLPKYKDFVKGFAVDTFIANWDVSGTANTADNLIMDNNGNVTRIDPGGSLTFRARGQKKYESFTDEVNELKTMRDEEYSLAAKAYNSHREMIILSFDNFFSKSWNELKTHLINFEFDNIYKPIKNMITDSELKDDILTSWEVEFKQILSKLEKRHQYMEKIYRKIENE